MPAIGNINQQVPGVYVFIEPRKTLMEGIASGRSVYVVILGDRGPHNRIVKVTSSDNFIGKFGPPNFERTGSGHYLVDAALRWTDEVYVCRVVPTPDNGFDEDESVAIANIGVFARTNCETIVGSYTFFTEKDTSFVDAAVPTDPTLINMWVVGGWSSHDPEDLRYAKYVTEVSGAGYRLSGKYEGRTSENAYLFAVKQVADQITATAPDEFTFTVNEAGDPNSAIVASNAALIASLRVGDTITVGADGPEHKTRIIAIDRINNKIILEKPYSGDTTSPFTQLNYFRDYGDAAPGGVRRKAYRFANGSSYVYCKDREAFEVFVDMGANQLRSNFMWIFRTGATDWGDTPDKALRIVDFYYNEDSGVYRLKLSDTYQGETTDMFEWDYAGVLGSLPVVDTSVAIAFDDVFETRHDTGITFYGSDWRTDLVKCGGITDYAAIDVGDWIYKQGDSIDNLRQVISKYANESGYYLVLSSGYDGTPGTGNIEKCTNIVLDGMPNINTFDELRAIETYPDTIFFFYATGAGSWYNNIRIAAVRNRALERMFVDDDGNVLYKYIFWDIYVYYLGEDGNFSLIETPMTVSIVPYVYYNGQKQNVIDPNSGQSMYIEDVFERYAEHVRVISGPGVSKLIEDENLRLALLLQFSAEDTVDGAVASKKDVYLRYGDDGILFDAFGRLNFNNPKLTGLVARAYRGTLKSTDGSVELLTMSLYPWYVFNYVLTGGYPLEVTQAAVELADARQDMYVVADLGFHTRVEDEVHTRIYEFNINSFNVSFYSQYRKIFDEYNGKRIWMTPVYHAIIAHLRTDATYGFTEPAFGFEKGSVNERIELAYVPRTTAEIAALIDAEINPTIFEKDGTYIIQQLTAFKRLSYLRMANVVKTLHVIKDLARKILKDIISRKRTPFWVNEIVTRLSTMLNDFLIDNNRTRTGLFEYYNIDVHLPPNVNEVDVLIELKPVEVIERIIVRLIS